MRTNIVIALDTRYKSKKNLYPVILRISHNGRNTSIKLGYSISENDWDETKRQIKKSHSNAESVARMNNLILKKRLDALNVVTRLEEQGKLTNMP
ncbi:MAG: Arm DNA-binding domain-containing protein, partial [Chitinophagales bacterium]